MPHYRLTTAYLASGWAHDVRVSVSDDGLITGIGAEAEAGAAQLIDGVVVPGMPNAHSHAFQRAMAGDTEYRLSAHDSFWTWRQSMYALANKLEPEDLSLVAQQVYVEMLKAGYTSVAEFHYLHRCRDGSAYTSQNALWQAIIEAARLSGIGLTLLPTLYQTSDFGGAALKPEQRRFHHDTEAFLRAVETQRKAHAGTALCRTGVAFHSLRAVPLEQLSRATLALKAMDATMPLHIHIAEQQLEVDACLRVTGRRPIELLMQTGLIDAHWCLVHATHATLGEITAIAASGAAVCVSISTEANLGDGFFNATDFLAARGHLCVGSDSQSTVNPAEELRWLEYQQRLRRQQRGVLARDEESHVGTVLWRDAAAAGARALGQPVGQIAVGSRADWLVLDPEHPALAGGSASTLLDRLIFAGGDRAIRDVMVGGQWVVRDGRHAADESLRLGFGALLKRLS
jgi:formimidoylglutamate deiminase